MLTMGTSALADDGSKIVQFPGWGEKLNTAKPHNYSVGEKQEVFPFKKAEDIANMRAYFSGRGEWRNELLFVLGINIGLRASDLLKLQWDQLMDEDGVITDGITVREKKTKKFRTFYLNSSACTAIRYFFLKMVERNIEFVNEMCRGGKMNRSDAGEIVRLLSKQTLQSAHEATAKYIDLVESGRFVAPKGNKGRYYTFEYLFSSGKVGAPLEVRSAEKILKTAAKEIGIKFNVGTHSLRKTFGYHQLKTHDDNATFLCELQEMFGHSSPQITLRYCGLGGEKICQYYNDVNLG